MTVTSSAVRNFLLMISAVIICILTALSRGQTIKPDVQLELIKYLKNNITDFSPLARPTLDPKEAVNVSLTLMVNQIVFVDSAKQSVKISAMLTANWVEQRLVWNPALFGNVSVVDWDSSQIWFPAIFVYNGIGDNQLLKAQLPVYLTSLSPAATIATSIWKQEWEFSCSFDMTRFPMDRHSCEIEFYISDQGRGMKTTRPLKGSPLVPQTLEYNEMSGYVDNSEWLLRNTSTFLREKKFEIFKGLPLVSLPTFVMHMDIERVSTYYMMNVVTPLLLLTLLQVLVFFVPVESGEKLGFGITIMLSYTVFLLLMDGILPKSQSIPTVASFITSAMVLSTVSLGLTSIIIRFHFAPDSMPMPSCLRFVFVGCLGRLLCSWGNRREGTVQPNGDTDTNNCDGTEPDGESPTESGGGRLSDWQVASLALERLMVIVGALVTIAIFCVFLLRPLVG